MNGLTIVLAAVGTVAYIAGLAVLLERWKKARLRRPASTPPFQEIHDEAPTMVLGEILPAGEMKVKYHLTADRYQPPTFDPGRVPEHLRDLLPLARKWGIGDDIIRDDLERKASDVEKQELQEALRGRTRAINEWLDSFGNAPMPEEAAAFMYMCEALDEMRLWVE